MALKHASADLSKGLPICCILIHEAELSNVVGTASSSNALFSLIEMSERYFLSIQKESDCDIAVAANTLTCGSNDCICLSLFIFIHLH